MSEPCFEVFRHRGASGSSRARLWLTITRGGRQLRLSRGAHDLLGERSLVELMYDAQAGIVGIRATDDAHGFQIQASSAITGTGFCDHFGITAPETLRYSASWSDGVLIVPLIDGVPVVGNHTGRGLRAVAA